MMANDVIIISLGGSIIVPDEINVDFLKEFSALVREHAEKGHRICIVCGGGKTARKYMAAARQLGDLTAEDLDWLGIHGTRLNAHLLRTMFRDIAHKEVVKDPSGRISFKEKVLIAAGWQPGWSTDYDAVLLAKNLGAKVIINLFDQDAVYDKDPNKFEFANPLPKLSWKQFRTIVGDKWDPGLNTPFDPVASKEAEKLGLKVVVMKGTDLDNLRTYLAGESFRGTTIG